MLALSGYGTYGRQHARAIFARLREIFCQDWSSVRQYAGEEPDAGRFGADSNESYGVGSSAGGRDRVICHYIYHS